MKSERNAAPYVVLLAFLLTLAGCMYENYSSSSAHHEPDHVTASVDDPAFVTPKVRSEAEVEAAKTHINIEEVERLLKESRADAGADTKDWIAAFEHRVNEIYEGDEVISIHLSKTDGKLKIVGFIERNWMAGYQVDDELVFQFEEQDATQTSGSSVPVRITAVTHGGHVVEHHSSFTQDMFYYLMLRQLFLQPHSNYYSSSSRLIEVRTSRESFRASPGYVSQRDRNSNFGQRLSSGSSPWASRAAPTGLRLPTASSGTAARSTSTATGTAAPKASSGHTSSGTSTSTYRAPAPSSSTSTYRAPAPSSPSSFSGRR